MSPKKKQRKSTPTSQHSHTDVKIGKAAENGTFAVNTLFRIAADRLADKCPYLSNYMNFDLPEEEKPSPNKYLEMHTASIQANNPRYVIPARVRDDLLVKYTEQESAFRSDLISSKVLTSELLKHYKLKKPNFLMLNTAELVQSLRQTVNDTYGVNRDDRRDAAKEMYESLRMTNTETIDAYTSRFKDAVNQYNNYLADGRKLTTNELNRHFMKNLTSEFESERLELKNEEDLKMKFASVFQTLNVEGADAAFNATDIGYPDTIDKLRDKVHDKAMERRKNSRVWKSEIICHHKV